VTRVLGRSDTPKPTPDSMTLFEHLAELRRRLIISLAAFVIGGTICWVFYTPIFEFLTRPYLHSAACMKDGKEICFLTVLAPLQGFTTKLNVCAYGGLVIALPIILWQLWKFVTPGLKSNERRYALPFVIATVVLFALGGITAYLIYPHGLTWLLQQSGPRTTPAVSVQSYVDLICVLILIFGLTFEFPAVLVGLELGGALTSAQLRRVRRFAFIGIVVFSAFITPSSDPFSMMALVVPLTLFYEGAIVVGRLAGK
jgi:sec-independent protein translocase protein TatC